MSRLDLWPRRDEPVAGLAPLDRRRLSLARALFHRPALLFADAPTDKLDHDATEMFHQDWARLVAHEGVTLLLASRFLTELDSLCTAAAVLRHGQIIASGPVAELRQARAAPMLEITGRGFTEQVLALFGRRTEIAQVNLVDNRLLVQLHQDRDTAPLVSLLVESGVDIDEVRRVPAALDSVLDTLVRKEV